VPVPRAIELPARGQFYYWSFFPKNLFAKNKNRPQLRGFPTIWQLTQNLRTANSDFSYPIELFFCPPNQDPTRLTEKYPKLFGCTEQNRGFMWILPI
jgi:hypothetical protein